MLNSLSVEEFKIDTSLDTFEIEKKLSAFLLAAKIVGYETRVKSVGFKETKVAGAYIISSNPFKQIHLRNSEKMFILNFMLNRDNTLKSITILARRHNEESNIVKSCIKENEILEYLDLLIDFL